MTNTFDVRSLIYGALLDEKLLADAQRRWKEVAADTLSRNHDRAPGTLRASDAGRCQRELWADLNGKRDLPEDPQGLLKMNGGSLMGAWLACLLAAAVEAKGYAADVEVETEHEGVSGHCDLVIGENNTASEEITPLLVIEFKWSAWSGAHDGPKPYHITQAGKYALAVGAPEFQIVQYFPSTQARWDKTIGAKVSEPHIFPSEVFRTDDYAAIVAKEYTRLRGALSVEMAIDDPAESFRCRSCRFSGCDRNTNPLNTNANNLNQGETA
jgi:hypothetical protein